MQTLVGILLVLVLLSITTTTPPLVLLLLIVLILGIFSNNKHLPECVHIGFLVLLDVVLLVGTFLPENSRILDYRGVPQ